MQADTRHLKFRAGHWHYNRRVPARYCAYDDRGRIRASLKTTSLDTARERRDAMVEADNLYWASMVGVDGSAGNERAVEAQHTIAQRRYSAANKRAMARGFSYAPADDLARVVEFEDLITRIKLVDEQDKGKKSWREEHEAESLLGGVKVPPVKISEAFDIYCDQIAADMLIGKSPAQRRSWMKTKKRGVSYLISLIGDKPLLSITRQDAQGYYQWWKDRLIPKKGQKALKANTANRDLGNVRKLFFEYCRYIGEEDRPNPFRNLSFVDNIKASVPPFSDDWVRSRIMETWCSQWHERSSRFDCLCTY